MIVCAAIKLIQETLYGVELNPKNELVVCGHRHGDCLKVIQQLGARWFNVKHIQGFIDHNGNFLDRKEALAHAIECGQLSATHRYYREDNNIDELYSEDLY